MKNNNENSPFGGLFEQLGAATSKTAKLGYTETSGGALQRIATGNAVYLLKKDELNEVEVQLLTTILNYLSSK